MVCAGDASKKDLERLVKASDLDIEQVSPLCR